MQASRIFWYRALPIAAAIGGVLYFAGCGNSGSSTEDSSTSGSVAATLGGSVNASSASGTQAMNERIRRGSWLDALPFSIPDALAGTACPTFASSSSAGCSVSGPDMTLTYGSGCSFGSSAAVWTGSQTLALSTGTPTCGTFPAGGSYGGTLTRTFSAGSTRTSAAGIVVTIDTAGTDAGVPSGVTAPSGGVVVHFASGTRNQIDIDGVNLIGASSAGVAKFNHSISTTVTGGANIVLNGASVTSGTVITYHNLLKIQASSAVTGLGFSAGCCTPTSGTITTSFSAISGVTPTLIGSAFVGKTETLQFTSCGKATYTGPEGYSGAVTLGHCF
jgi:hypothetical protein